MADTMWSAYNSPGSPLNPATAILAAGVAADQTYKLTVAELATLLSTKSNYLYDTAGTPLLSVDGVGRTLTDSSGTDVVGWESAIISDLSGQQSIDWDNRQLLDPDGVTPIADWSNTANASAKLSWQDGRMLVNGATDDTSSALQVEGNTRTFTLDVTSQFYVGSSGQLGINTLGFLQTSGQVIAAAFEGDGSSLTGLITTQVGYVPVVPGDWDGDPVNVQEALDRIAAAVAGLLTVPIP